MKFSSFLHVYFHFVLFLSVSFCLKCVNFALLLSITHILALSLFIYNTT